ncbi:hypothetical protein TPA0908_53130 [Micromonospora sp. AKA38]|nr:hypothetical protein TPA0908_53130 [Micromonospora sp. AKA38]
MTDRPARLTPGSALIRARLHSDRDPVPARLRRRAEYRLRPVSGAGEDRNYPEQALRLPATGAVPSLRAR